MIVTYYDRWFLDRIAIQIIVAEGDSQLPFFKGNFHEYEEDKKKQLGEEGAKPKRIRYKLIATSATTLSIKSPQKRGLFHCFSRWLLRSAAISGVSTQPAKTNTLCST